MDQTLQKEPQQHLSFNLDGETYAIGILHIKEIIEYGQLTVVPMMPPYIRGVINLRGSVVPVVDMAVRFGRERTEVKRRTCIIILEVAAGEGQQEIGVVVDAVNEVLEIPDSEIEPPPSFGTGIRSEFIRGMGKQDSRFIIILNVDRLLSVDELSMLEQAAASAS